MKSQKCFFTAILLGCLVCFSCSRTKVETQYDPLADFSKLKSYSLMPGTQVKIEDDRVNNAFLNINIQKAVENQMEKKGYPKSAAKTPDFFITFDALLEERARGISIPVNTDIRDWGAPGFTNDNETKYLHVRNYEDEEILILKAIDPKTKKIIWQGIGQSGVDFKDSWKNREKNISKTVQKILKDFPPKS